MDAPSFAILILATVVTAAGLVLVGRGDLSRQARASAAPTDLVLAALPLVAAAALLLAVWSAA